MFMPSLAPDETVSLSNKPVPPPEPNAVEISSLVPSNVRPDSAVAIALIATLIDLNVLSPERKVVALFVPLSPRRARGTVPDERFVAFKFVKDAPEPLNVVAVAVPVTVMPPFDVSNFFASL